MGVWNAEWGLKEGEWGMGSGVRGIISLLPTAYSPFPHSSDYDSAALVFAARLTLFLASGFFLCGEFAVDGLVIAALLGAVAGRLFLLGVVFFEQKRFAALRAGFGHGLVPEGRVAIRILEQP